MPIKEATLVVRLPGFGRETTNVKNWSIESDYLKSTDGFDFELWPYDSEGVRLGTGERRLELQPVELLLNGAKQLDGRIDITEVGNSGTAIKCWGRDFMADLVESDVDPSFKVKAGQTLQDVIFGVAGPVGVDAVVDDDEGVITQDVRTGIKTRRRGTGKRRKKQKLQEYDPKPDEGIYEYLVRLVARHGVTLQPGIDRGTIVVSSPWYEQEPIGTLRRSIDQQKSQRNNVKTSSARRDYSRMPSYALFNGFQAKKGKQSAGMSKDYDVTLLAGVSPELGTIIGNGTAANRIKPGDDAGERLGNGRLYRLLTLRDDAARTPEELENAIKRAVAERLKDSLAYTAVVRGHLDETTNAIWSINTMIRVEDEVCDIFEDLWIASRTLSFSDTEGAITTIQAWRPQSFVL